MCSLKLSAGYSIIDYNHNKYKLKKIFIEELKQRLKLKKKLELETFHHLFDVKNNFEELRQQCFLIFKTEKFKQSYLSIVKDLIQTFFSRSALVQKFPTIRIQSPSQSAAPYHNDNWFGHGKDVINFWLPLSQIDKYNSYAQKGSFPVTQHMIASAIELFPVLSRLRMLRHWGGIVDTCPDASPIISKTEIEGLYFNCGWGTGGFKATPGSGHVFADLLANDKPNEISKPFSLERFEKGILIDEHGAAGVAH